MNREGVNKNKLVMLSSVLVIMVIILILTAIFSSNNGSSDVFDESNDIKEVYRTYDKINDKAYLSGISDSGKIIPLVEEYDDGFTAFKLYKNKLFYVDDVNRVFEVDLDKIDGNSKELFATENEEVEDIYIVDKYIYLVTSSGLEVYSKNGEYVNTIDVILLGMFYITDDGKYLLYSDSEDDSVYEYDIESNVKTMIMEVANIVGVGNNRIYLKLFDANGEINYIYNVDTKEIKEFGYQLEVFVEYNNSIITVENKSIVKISLLEESEVLYTIPSEVTIDSIVSIVLLGDRLLIQGVVSTPEELSIGDFGYEYFLFDIKSKKITALGEEYNFIE